MNEENKKENIKEEWERANESSKAATLLFDNEFLKEAVSRLYYALLYAIRALLLTRSYEPRTHEGALRLFGLYFVKPGLMEIKDSHVFSKLMKFREEADYNPSYRFTREDFIELRQETEGVMVSIESYLRQQGYL